MKQKISYADHWIGKMLVWSIKDRIKEIKIDLLPWRIVEIENEK